MGGMNPRAGWRGLGGMVIALSALIRFWNLPQRGLYYFDEAMFVGNGRYFGGLLRALLEQLLHGRIDAHALLADAHALWQAGGSPWLHARPLHESLLVVGAFLFGDSVAVAQGISAVAGLASVALMLRIPVAGEKWSGLFAAALLGISLWHVQYSRCALTEAVSMLTVCVVLWLLPRRSAAPRSARQRAALCLAAGIAFTSHYNLFWLPSLVGCLLAGETWKEVSTVTGRVRSLTRAAFWMALPVLGFEALSWAWKYGLLWAFRHQAKAGAAIAFQLETYFTQLYNQIFLWHGGPQRALSPAFLPIFLFRQEHPLFASVLMAGCLHLGWRTLRGDAIARVWLLFILVPAALWTWFGYPAPRSFAPALPALCVGAAEGAGLACLRLERTLGYKRVTVVAGFVLIALFAVQSPRLFALMRAVSPWKTAAAHLAADQDARGGVIADTFLTGGYAHGILRYELGRRIDRSARRGDWFIWDATCRFPKWSRAPRLDSLASHVRPVEVFTAELSPGMILADAFDPEFIARYRARNLPHRFALFDLRLSPADSLAEGKGP